MFKKKQKCGVQEQNENKKVFFFSITCTWFQVNKPKDVNPDCLNIFFTLASVYVSFQLYPSSFPFWNAKTKTISFFKHTS